MSDPAVAELIIYCEFQFDTTAAGIFLENILRDPLYRRFRDRCIVYSSMDRVLPLVPGIYPSMEKGWHHQSRARSGPYLVDSNPFLRYESLRDQPEAEVWLASFFRQRPGSSDPSRVDEARRSADLACQQHGGLHRGDSCEDEVALSGLHKEFVATALKSKFVLCPRGFGSSSFRLFEAMRMGRAPIIIADAWVEPRGMDWGSFSIRVPEKQIASIPQILRKHEAQAIDMGEKARQNWEAHFGPTNLFRWIVEEALSVRDARVSRAATYPFTLMQIIRPYHLRRLVRAVKAKGHNLTRKLTSESAPPSRT